MTQLILLIGLLLASCQGLKFSAWYSSRPKGTLDVEKGLIKILEGVEGRGAKENNDQSEVFRSIEASIARLEESTSDLKNYNPITDDIDGTWRLLYTSSPGTNSPIQKTVTGFSGVSIYQVINIKNRSGSFLKDKVPDVSNTVVFNDLDARLRVTALASTSKDQLVVPRVGDGSILGFYPFGKSSSYPPRRKEERIDFAFQEAKLEAVKFPLGFYLPYPVPFKLLGDEAKGWLDQTYISKDFRVCRGNKGTCFLLQKVQDIESDRAATIATIPANSLPSLRNLSKIGSAHAFSVSSQNSDDTRNGSRKFSSGNIATLFQPSGKGESITMKKRMKKKKKKVVIIFPQQLGTGSDYEDLEAQLKEQMPVGTKIVTVPLTRLDWPIGLLPSLFSQEYLEASLTPRQALGFYLRKASEAAAGAVKAVVDQEEDVDVEISVVAHSIGGWIARVWISEWCDESLRDRVKALVTLGSPHNEPPQDTLMAKLDQTRGLLRYINEKYPGAHLPGVNYVSVIAQSVQGGLHKLSPLSALASGSYTALAGDGGAVGDGIVPVSAAILQGANNIVVGGDESVDGPVYHSNFVGPVKIASLPWYGSPSTVRQWVNQL